MSNHETTNNTRIVITDNQEYPETESLKDENVDMEINTSDRSDSSPATSQTKYPKNSVEEVAVYAEIKPRTKPFTLSHEFAQARAPSKPSSNKRQAPESPLDELPLTMDCSAYAPPGNNPEEPKECRRLYGILLKSFEGFLFIGEVLGALLCWILLAVWSYAEMPIYRMPPALGFSMFVYVTSWILTTLLFIILLTGKDDKFEWMSNLRETPFGMIYNFSWTFFYLIAGGLTASYAVKDMTQVLGASTAFAFILLIFHMAHAFLYFRRRFEKCPWNYIPFCHIDCTIKFTT